MLNTNLTRYNYKFFFFWFFIARGPRFKKNLTMKQFNNVDVYPLLCELLKIKCNSNNGSLSTFDSYLASKSSQLCLNSFSFINLLCFIVFFKFLN